uniref:Uncharacterized protein n=1 Tax=Tanacetum cinerariifolium TaxID=118510 RepID=A0A6L2P3N8_TANCI|nr:hypothetical protein [Tanacetum cinerariifolium]
MRADELYKFSDATLKKGMDELHHRVLDFNLGYNKEIERRKWKTTDKKRSALMVDLIDKQMHKRRIIQNLESIDDFHSFVVVETKEILTLGVDRVNSLEEEMAKDDQRMNEKITRDAKTIRIHAEEELQIMIDGLDKNNETVAKYLQEYEQFAAELSIEESIELISDLVKYQDNYAKVLKYQTQQSKPLSKKQQREFYMLVLKSHAGWKAKYFKGMTLEEIREKFDPDSAKKVKISEEVSEEDLKEMMQLVPVEEHFDREDLNQLWALVKETLSIRPTTSDKEKKLWVELKRLYEPDVEDQLWSQTQALMHATLEWRLYDSCGKEVIEGILSRPVRIRLSKVELLLVAFDTQLKVFYTSLDDDASCEHSKRDIKCKTFFNSQICQLALYKKQQHIFDVLDA